MCYRVVTLDGGTADGVHHHLNLAARLQRGIALDEMQESVASLLCVGDGPRFVANRQRTCVADLTAHLWIKR